MRIVLPLCCSLILGFTGAQAIAQQTGLSEETVTFFKQNCSSCHTVGGGKLAGPDLKGVSDRAERAWLIEFLQDPKGVIDSGDSYAQGLFSEARGVYMPTTPGMTADRAGKLLDLIDYESAQERSQFSGLTVSDRPLTAADTARGEALFLGRQFLQQGGPACVGCHTVAGFAGYGGGRLGPDLTHAFARLDGRRPLAAWLSAPPSPVMQPLYKQRPLDGEEVLQIIAFLQDQTQAGKAEASSSALVLLLAGIAMAAVMLVALDILWRNRYRAMRRPLVTES